MRGRLTPSKLELLLSRCVPSRSPFVPTPQGEFIVRARVDEESGATLIITSPVHDLAEGDKNFALTAGMVSLAVGIAGIPKCAKNWDVFIPLAQCRGRQHWTLLHRDKQGNFHFYDPKAQLASGVVSYFFDYDLSHIQAALPGQVGVHYTGIQSLTDGTICGYVVAHLIATLSCGATLDEARRSFKIEVYKEHLNVLAASAREDASAPLLPDGADDDMEYPENDADAALEALVAGVEEDDDEWLVVPPGGVAGAGGSINQPSPASPARSDQGRRSRVGSVAGNAYGTFPKSAASPAASTQSSASGSSERNAQDAAPEKTGCFSWMKKFCC